MKAEEFVLLIIYFSTNVYAAQSSDVYFPVQTKREFITKLGDAQNAPMQFGSRISLTRSLESNHEEKPIRLLTTPVMHHKQQTERKSGKASAEEIRQLIHNHHRGYNEERSNNNDLKQSSGNLRANSQNNFLGRRLPSKNACISSLDGNRQRCLRKIKKKKGTTLFNNISHRKQFDNSFSTNLKNVSLNMSGYAKNLSSITININNQSFEDNFKPVQTTWGSNLKNSSETSKPCTCYWRPDSCGCDCTGSMHYDDFQETSKGLFPCRNFTFTITGGQHYAIPPNFFTNVKRVEVFSLIITNSTFEYICDPTPMTSPFKDVMFSVSAMIKLKNASAKRGWNWKPFEQLRSSAGGQVDIVIEGCKLRRLTSDFSNMVGGEVDTINISNSNLEMVGSNAFGTFVNMTNFRVPDNKIRNLRRTDFPKILPKLVEIDLRNNQLRNLDEDLFRNMPILKQISLSGNPLIVLSEKTFHDVIGQAHLAGLSDLPLNCDCRLRWLKDARMSSNAVTKRNMIGAICRRPSYLRGIPLEYLRKEHLICT